MRIRRILKAAAFLIYGIVAAAVLSGATFEQLARNRAARDITMPGRLVTVGERKIQMDCRGAGSPTVVLESGLDTYGSLGWAAVHDSIAATTRTCAYSRPGVMWSDASSSAFDSDSLARTLHSALVAAGESAPWVMAGHSLGGPYIVTFAAKYGDEVKGLVMVDATHPDQFPAMDRIAGKSIMPTPTLPRVAAALAWTGLVRMVASGPLPAAYPVALASGAPAYVPTSLASVASEAAAIPTTLVREKRVRSLGDRPFIVLGVTGVMPDAELAQVGITREQGKRLAELHTRLAMDMATWSTRGRYVAVDRSTHYIQLDRPDAVIAAVREVVREARRRAGKAEAL